MGQRGEAPLSPHSSRVCLYECTDLTRLSSALPISAFKAGKVQTKERRDDGAGFSLPRRGLILHCFGVYRQTETVYAVFFYTISLNCSSVIIGTFSSFAFLFFPEFDVISLFIRKSVFDDTAEATFAPLASMKSFSSFLFFQI